MTDQEMRIQKFLSRAGVCSRRKAEQHMLDGRIRVNGEIVRELGSKVIAGRDTVEFDGKPVTRDDSFVYILMNKPPSHITSLDDPKGRPTVADLLPANMPRIWPVGRLDWDTEGLLIMTNDGKLTHLITHPSHEVPKTYAVKIRGLFKNSSEGLERVRQGVEIEGGYVTRPARAVVTGDNGRNTWLEVTINEGKNRQIRKMFEAIGAFVMKLRRISIGNIHIQGISSGEYRSMTHAEVVDLYDLVEANMPNRAIPSDRALKRERQAIERGNLPDHESRKEKLFDS